MNRLCISSWSFHNLFTCTRYKSARVPEKDMDILDFPELIADSYHIHNLEVVSKHLASTSQSYFTEFRERLNKAHSWLINIPVDIDELWDQPSISSPDEKARSRALQLYMPWIDHAAALGAESVRCDPGILNLDDPSLTIDSYRKLVAHGRSRNIAVNVENHGKAAAHPEELAKILQASRASALPDIGNFPDHETRLRGLKAMFPLAGNICHVKFDPASFDFAECIGIAKDAGFKGVYSIEADDVQNVVGELTRCLS
jgi:sugar phosphate isomerase/epimerase